MTVHPAEAPALDWCDHRSHLVPPGTTRPYTADQRYRACGECMDAMRAEVAARETFCPDCNFLGSLHRNGRCPQELGSNGARARGADR